MITGVEMPVILTELSASEGFLAAKSFKTYSFSARKIIHLHCYIYLPNMRLQLLNTLAKPLYKDICHHSMIMLLFSVITFISSAVAKLVNASVFFVFEMNNGPKMHGVFPFSFCLNG